MSVNRGFQEAVACVADAAAAAKQLLALTGWDERHRGDLDPRLLHSWGVDAGCRGWEVLLGAGSPGSGQLRLLQLEGAAQSPIRSNPQSWDVGGYLDLNVRVTDMERRWREFSAARWHGTSDPVEWMFGDKLVSEWLALGPDGLAFALIERLDPPLPPGAVPGGFGHLFNSSQVVADMQIALDFYERVLGFRKFLHICQPLLARPGENPLGIPHNLVSELDVEIAILSPGGEMEGSVELIRMHGLEGRNFAHRARPPNLGVLSLRFPVEDAREFAGGLQAAGQELAMEPTRLSLPPHGECLMLALQAPDGAWLEFFSPA